MLLCSKSKLPHFCQLLYLYISCVKSNQTKVYYQNNINMRSEFLHTYRNSAKLWQVYLKKIPEPIKTFSKPNFNHICMVNIDTKSWARFMLFVCAWQLVVVKNNRLRNPLLDAYIAVFFSISEYWRCKVEKICTVAVRFAQPVAVAKADWHCSHWIKTDLFARSGQRQVRTGLAIT